jgi:LacI family transcriptional regulator
MADRTKSTLLSPSEPSARVTLREMAQQSGLSIGTVSRILNNRNKGVWASTVSREHAVRKLAAKLGYRPNFSARSLRNQKAHTVALVYGHTLPQLYGVYEAIARSIVGVLSPHEYHLLFLPLPPDEIESWPMGLLSDGRIDGCIAMDPLPDVVVDALGQSVMPFVAINVDRPVPSVCPDDVGGMRLIMDYLLGLGHRRIAFYAGPHDGSEHFSLAVRKQTYAERMARAGLSEHVRIVVEEPEGFAASLSDQARTARPTAVVVYQALQAMPIHRAMLKHAIRIPDDISLATFDDLMALQWLTPSLTAVSVPMDELGALAAQLLLGRLDRGTDLPEKPVFLPERLVVRESTASPGT